MTAFFGKGDVGRATFVMIGLATALRVLWGVLVPVAPVSDQVAYLTFATNIALHGVYGWTPDAPSAYWAVGTAAIYAGIFKIFGIAFWPIVAFNIAVGTALVAATMALARIMCGDRVALVTGALMAFWPSQIYFVTVLASELPFMLLVVAASWAWLRTEWTISQRGVAVGFLVAAASYVRPVALLLPAVFMISLGFPRWPGGTFRQHVRVVIIAVVVMAVSIAPWAARNHHAFGSFVLISTNGWPNFWMGNNPNAAGGYMPLPEGVMGLDEIARSKMLGAEARGYVIENPGLFVLRTMTKMVQLHLRETIGVHWNQGLKDSIFRGLESPLKVIATGYWLVAIFLTLAALVGTYAQIGWRLFFFLPVAIWGYVTAVHAITVVDDRYHFPAIPYISVLAAVSLCRWQVFGWRRGSTDVGKGRDA